MDLISLIVVLAVLGLIFWAVQSLAPIAQPFKNIILLLLVVIACIWLLESIGLGHGRLRL